MDVKKEGENIEDKKVDDKPMVIKISHKEKAKIHAHEPKGAKIKGSIYTVERDRKCMMLKPIENG